MKNGIRHTPRYFSGSTALGKTVAVKLTILTVNVRIWSVKIKVKKNMQMFINSDYGLRYRAS